MKANRLLNMFETGGPDQDYDYAYYTTICRDITKRTGYRCTHKEFDKYQGIFLYIRSPKGGAAIVSEERFPEPEDDLTGWWIHGTPNNEIYEVEIAGSGKSYIVNSEVLSDALKSFFKSKGK